MNFQSVIYTFDLKRLVKKKTFHFMTNFFFRKLRDPKISISIPFFWCLLFINLINPWGASSINMFIMTHKYQGNEE